MSVWDHSWELPNLEHSTGGGKIFWDCLAQDHGYILQRNRLTGHCRILRAGDLVRLAWGQEGPLRAKFRALTHSSTPVHPRYGDVIGVHRRGGLYDHYGVYEHDRCVYQYGNDPAGRLDIHTTTLEQFIGEADGCFILAFPDRHSAPGKIEAVRPLGTMVPQLWNGWMQQESEYHLYTPKETIQRAKSRLGESDYDLLENNCEHFALWCKTGIRESHQIEVLKTLVRLIPWERLGETD